MEHDESHAAAAAPDGPQFGSARGSKIPGINPPVLVTLLLAVGALLLIIFSGIFGQFLSHPQAASAMAAAKEEQPSVLGKPARDPASLASPIAEQTEPPGGVPTPPGDPAGAGALGAGGLGATPAPCTQQLSPGYVGEISPQCQQLAGGNGASANGGTHQPTAAELAAQDRQRREVQAAEDHAKLVQQAYESKSLLAADFSAQQAQALRTPAPVDSTGMQPTTDPRATMLVPAPAPALFTPQRPVLLHGWKIPVTLIDEVNCAIPGGVIAQVRQSVRDSWTGDYTLIPVGARVIGDCSGSTFRQTRVDLRWTEIQFPNHQILRFGSGDPKDGLASADSKGTSAIAGHVDDHRGSLIITGLIATAIAAGAAYVDEQQYKQSNSGGVNVSVGGSGVSPGAAVAQGVFNLANQLNALDAGKPNVITLTHATPFNLVVDRNIELPPYSAANPYDGAESAPKGGVN